MSPKDNNCSDTVLELFEKATIEVDCIPRAVRSDKGGENVGVCQFMLANNCEFITGRSVHNQRIERLWRDLSSSVTKFYRRYLDALENVIDEQGRQVLDIDDELDLWALHYVYLPRLKQSCEEWLNGWNLHNLDGMYKSPLQIYIDDSIRQQNQTDSTEESSEDEDFEDGAAGGGSELENQEQDLPQVQRQQKRCSEDQKKIGDAL